MVLSLFDFVLLIANLVLLTSIACYYSYANEKIKRLEANKPRPVDTQLISDIVSDLQQRGFALVRLDSADILYRSPRG